MKFRAFVVEAVEENKYLGSIVEREVEDLPAGDVLVKVSYSSLNFKDGLSSTGVKGVTRQYPHTPGIDAVGVVVSSESGLFDPEDQVIVTGYDLGMNTAGGYGEYIRVPADWLVRKPEGLTDKECMSLGTAGITAAMCVDSLWQVGVRPEQGEILVTGATGGVGVIAISLLKKLGFDVVAGTGKIDQKDFLASLGAGEFIGRDELNAGADRAMLKERWAGVIDTVGGDILFNAVKSTRYGGSVACCGMAASANFSANVFPFIIRGINLLGVDSVELPLDVKESLWHMLANEWKLDNFDKLSREIGLDGLLPEIDKILKGQQVGRVVVRLEA